MSPCSVIIAPFNDQGADSILQIHGNVAGYDDRLVHSEYEQAQPTRGHPAVLPRVRRAARAGNTTLRAVRCRAAGCDQAASLLLEHVRPARGAPATAYRASTIERYREL